MARETQPSRVTTVVAAVVLAVALTAAPATAKKGGQPAHGEPAAPSAGPLATPPGQLPKPNPRGRGRGKKPPKPPSAPVIPRPTTLPPVSPPPLVPTQPTGSAVAVPAPAPAPDRQIVLDERVAGSDTAARRTATRPPARARAGTGARPPAARTTAAVPAGVSARPTAPPDAGARDETQATVARPVTGVLTVPNLREGMGAPTGVTRLVRVIPGFVWLMLGIMAVVAGLLAAALWVYARRLRRADEHARALAGLAATDVLTGLLNRRGMEDRLSTELARARRYGGTLAVVFGDLRSLKRINDRHGHEAGDRALRTVADVLRGQVREGDSCARVGGDEYAVTLVNQGADGATAFCDRVRKRLASVQGPDGFEDLELTMGVGLYPRDGDTVESLFAAADRDLYAQRGIEVGG